MKKIKLIGEPLSRNEMKNINGGVTDPGLTCKTNCYVQYYGGCSDAGLSKSYCDKQAGIYCANLCDSIFK
ncbi:MAG: hypothetical protein HYX40_03265 [Sphingobacteriales bacterium]|nr:hypothetical protein [Sphingobacteriales bacterium]